MDLLVVSCCSNMVSKRGAVVKIPISYHNNKTKHSENIEFIHLLDGSVVPSLNNFSL